MNSLSPSPFSSAGSNTADLLNAMVESDTEESERQQKLRDTYQKEKKSQEEINIAMATKFDKDRLEVCKRARDQSTRGFFCLHKS